jgi:hypothetical protein
LQHHVRCNLNPQNRNESKIKIVTESSTKIDFR